MKILFVSLGCDKNLVDSEHMLGKLAGRGFSMTDDEAEADVIIINTCCFIDSAKEESIQTILDLSRMKQDGICKALIVTGCMAERYKEEVLKEIPEVDAIVGTSSYDKIEEAIRSACSGEKAALFDDLNRMPKGEHKRIMTTGGCYEYLKIAEGCDKHCTYCVIPSLRGAYRSVPMEELLEEARSLAQDGVRELILVAQETTCYGMDLYGKKSLHLLLKKLCGISGIRWIRILYCYPEEIYPELIQTMKEEPKICHYLDLPIQHASDRILKRMGRKTSRGDLERIIGDLRKEIPDIALRTTLITGFPGETSADHIELMDFVSRMRFDRLGVFTYSREEGTPAAAMDGQVDGETMQNRRDELLTLQQDISKERGKSFQGKILEVQIEGEIPEDHTFVGRTYADAPNVDGYFFVHSEETLHTGDFVSARATGSMEYDLIGEYTGEVL